MLNDLQRSNFAAGRKRAVVRPRLARRSSSAATRPDPGRREAASRQLCCPRKSRAFASSKPAHRCELNNAPTKASFERSRLNPSFRRTPAFSHSRSAIRAYARSSGAHLAKAASFRARPEALLLWTHRPVDPIGSPTAIPQSGRRAPRRETNLALAYSAPFSDPLRPSRYFRATLRGASGAKERGRFRGTASFRWGLQGLILFRRTSECYRESFSNKGPNHRHG